MPGKFADIVVLSDNPLTIEQDALIELEVLMTMIDGSAEYCLSGQAQVCPAESL